MVNLYHPERSGPVHSRPTLKKIPGVGKVSAQKLAKLG